MAKAPRVLYVRAMKDKNDVSYILAATDIKDLQINVGEKEKVGVYELASTLEVKGVLQTTEVTADQ
jgi:hypothetical protein